MSIPKFQVGEEVILQSVRYPEMNGEYIVRKVLGFGDVYKCRVTGKGVEWVDGDCFAYLLNDQPHRLNECGFENPWDESALRKKYKPSEESFEEMINKLKSKEVV